MRFIFCEDDKEKRIRFQAWWNKNRDAGLQEFHLEFACDREDALGKIATITDDDIVSLDSRLPNQGDGDEILAMIRRNGSKCLALWHSDVAVPKWAEKPDLHCFPFRQWDAQALIQRWITWKIEREGFEN